MPALGLYIACALMVVAGVSLGVSYFQGHGASYWQSVIAVSMVYGTSLWAVQKLIFG